MKLNESKYKDIIGEYFEYSMDWDFLDVVANILERIDFNAEDLHEDMIYAINDELVYTQDQWTIMEHYQTPDTASLEDAWYSLESDIFSLVEKIKA